MGERIFDNIVLMCMNGFYNFWIEESCLHRKKYLFRTFYIKKIKLLLRQYKHKLVFKR